MSTNTKQTSKKVASIAAKILHSKDATDTEKNWLPLHFHKAVAINKQALSWRIWHLWF